MSDSVKQSPLGANSAASLLQNTGLTINPVAQSYMGVSKTNDDFTPGKAVDTTCLRMLTYAMQVAYDNGNLSSPTYDDLLSIGTGFVPALGNSAPPTYVIEDPSGEWAGQATTGYGIAGDTDQGQDATWIPFDSSNPNASVTKYGFLRLFALQAWNEFNWNGEPTGSVSYKDFTSSFMACDGFLTNTNTMINVFKHGPNFMKGVYSNMDDLISGDITNVSLSTSVFGQDCIALGKAIDLTKIQKFGLPSVLLQTLKKYNAITQSISVALISAGLSNNEIESFSIGSGNPTDLQEQQIYGAFLIIMGQDLKEVLVPLNCKTKGLDSLADLLNIRKMFPNSYRTITVPIYNTVKSATNSKTFYPIYDSSGISSRLTSPSVKDIVGTIVIPGKPNKRTNTTGKNVQELPKGFDSYLVGILPPDVAVAAGAFSYSMQQIKNITQVDFEKFSQVATNIETTKNLNLVGGTDVPVNSALVNQGHSMVALGSGPNGTYTTSDFFGCMSGLPYDWKKLTSLITNTQTTKLANIYHELYLAVAWEAPVVNPVYTTWKYSGTPYYHLIGAEIEGSSGITQMEWNTLGLMALGYTKQTNPSYATFLNQCGVWGTGLSFDVTVDIYFPYTGTYNIEGSCDNFGHVDVDGSTVLNIPGFGISYTSTFIVAAGYHTVRIVGTDAGPPAAIAVRIQGSVITEPVYGITGGGYTRGTAPTPSVQFTNGASGTVVIGTDVNDIETFGRITAVTVTPFTGNDSTTIPAIQIQCPPTGELPVSTSGSISTSGTNTAYDTTGWAQPMDTVVQAYIAQANLEIETIAGTGSRNVDKLTELYDKFGAQLTIEQRARFIGLSPVPIPRDTKLNSFPTTIMTFVDSLAAYAKNTMPQMQAQTIEAITDLNSVGGQSMVAGMRESRNSDRLQLIGVAQDNNIPGTLDPNAEKEVLCNGPSTEIQEIDGKEYQPEPMGALMNVPPYQTPVYVIDGKPLDLGQADYPGSFAGSKAINLIPINLNVAYTSGTRLPASLTPQEAIDQVIHCNCDCWI